MIWALAVSLTVTRFSSGTMAPAVRAHVEAGDVLRLRAELAGRPARTRGSVRLLKSKSFTYAEPMKICMASVIWPSGTCSALRLLAVDRHHELGVVRGEAAEEAAEVGARVSLLRDLAA